MAKKEGFTAVPESITNTVPTKKNDDGTWECGSFSGLEI